MKKLPKKVQVLVEALQSNPNRMVTDEKCIALLEKHEKAIGAYLKKSDVVKSKLKQQVYCALIDLCMDDELVVFDMKRKTMERIRDVCMNGSTIQLTIRPVVSK